MKDTVLYDLEEWRLIGDPAELQTNYDASHSLKTSSTSTLIRLHGVNAGRTRLARAGQPTSSKESGRHLMICVHFPESYHRPQLSDIPEPYMQQNMYREPVHGLLRLPHRSNFVIVIRPHCAHEYEYTYVKPIAPVM
jgi:hypothetical protein